MSSLVWSINLNFTFPLWPFPHSAPVPLSRAGSVIRDVTFLDTRCYTFLLVAELPLWGLLHNAVKCNHNRQCRLWINKHQHGSPEPQYYQCPLSLSVHICIPDHVKGEVWRESAQSTVVHGHWVLLVGKSEKLIQYRQDSELAANTNQMGHRNLPLCPIRLMLATSSAIQSMLY